MKVPFTFHTHPSEAYLRHNLSLGWPSTQDYITSVYSMINGCAAHFVISKEGVYVISLTKESIIEFMDMSSLFMKLHHLLILEMEIFIIGLINLKILDGVEPQIFKLFSI